MHDDDTPKPGMFESGLKAVLFLGVCAIVAAVMVASFAVIVYAGRTIL